MTDDWDFYFFSIKDWPASIALDLGAARSAPDPAFMFPASPGADPGRSGATGERSPYASTIDEKRAPAAHAAGALREARHT